MPRRPAALLFLCCATAGAPAAPPKVPAFDVSSYRAVGPANGGRVSRACGVAGDPLTLYAAAASGGVWKSSDGGLNWKPIFDDQPTASIGSIAVAPSDPSVVYVGTGEANIRGNVSAGAGVFKSDDAGRTWKHVWKQAGQIGTVCVHPKDPDTAFAAVLGRAFGPNPERGVYRTTDGGKSWAQVLKVDADTGASDVCVDPNNPRVVFAGTWQARRRPWELTSGGPGSGLHVSRDGGTTWESLKKGAPDNGLPPGVWGKVGVAVAPSDSSRVYTIIEADTGGLFRSDDGGRSWSVVNTTRPLRQRAWYYSTLTVHPTNSEVVWAPQVDLLKSIDGGKTFQTVTGPHHGDHHDIWVDPKNPARVVNANDGGVDLSTDGGKTWTAPPLPITQFYHVHADNRTPFHVMGCMQDLGSASGPSRTPSGGVALSDWRRVGGGEAGHCVSDPRDPNIVYAGEYGGILTRYDHRTGVARNVTVNQTNPSGIDPAKHEFRFQWTAPVVVSVHEPSTVYHAGNVVFRTKDGGDTWDKVSPDLTRDDKRKQGWSGGPITGDNTGAETYCTVFALSESPKQKGLLWAGTDDGRVHVTKDGGSNWVEVTKNVPELPDWGTVECIEASPHAPGTAFLVVDNHRMDDPAPYCWKTTDFGATWTRITAGLDPDTHLNAVREDPAKPGLLYLATERGVCISPDAGATWQSLQLNLPTVPVADLVVKHDSLVVGTHGRSIWILDDLSVVRAGPLAAKGQAVFLYPVSPVTKSADNAGGRVSRHHSLSDAPNPPDGVVLVYALTDEVKEVKLTVADATGRVVTTVTGKRGAKDEPKDEDAPPKGGKVEHKMPCKTGPQSVTWDLTYDGAETIPGARVDAGDPAQGVPAPPGTYTATLTAAGKSVRVPVVVKPDPRLPAPPTDLARQTASALSPAQLFGLPVTAVVLGTTPPDAQTQFALSLRDDITTLTRTVVRVRLVQKQLALRKELLADRADAKELLAGSAELVAKLAALEGKLHNPKAKIVYDIFSARGGAMLYSQYTWILANATDGPGVPTKAMRDRAAACRKTLGELTTEFDRLAGPGLTSLNEKAKALGAPALYVPMGK